VKIISAALSIGHPLRSSQGWREHVSYPVVTEVLTENDEMIDTTTYVTERRKDAQLPTGAGQWWHRQHRGPFTGWQPSWF
jgi:hypothetical protein